MITDADITEIETKISQISDLGGLKALKDTYLGPEGTIKRELASLKTMTIDDRRQAGPQVQQAKQAIESLFESAFARIQGQSQESKLAAKAEALQTQAPKIGHLHPLSLTIRHMNQYFQRMGYSVYDGPEIENDEYNFQRLNVPKDHPAREMQDTIYIDAPNILLRTHTSSVEARALANLKPPFRVVCPAKVYRNEKPSKTNHFIFHQYQGVVVQEKVSLAELFGTLEMLFKHMYGDRVVMRFRNKYYPEVEPGVGPDMRCFNCEGKGCGVCKHAGWIEMGGGGIIHHNLLKAAGLDPKKWMGFAFGLGLDRWVMAKYNMTDIRTLLGGNVAYPYFENEKNL
jgi:phenylalanyl-tRNA synthetase alpha chain